MGRAGTTGVHGIRGGPAGDATTCRMKVVDPRQAAQKAARASYGRLLSILAARSRDIAASEDALSDAFLAALRSWPEAGVPENPDAWLLTAVRNSFKNAARHQAVVEASVADLLLLQDAAAPDVPAIPDDRLKLLFVCVNTRHVKFCNLPMKKAPFGASS